jgi:hypothetical protein
MEGYKWSKDFFDDVMLALALALEAAIGLSILFVAVL